MQPLVSEKIISLHMVLSFQTFMAGACKGADSKMLNDVQWQWLEVIDITISKFTPPVHFSSLFVYIYYLNQMSVEVS